MTGILQQPVIPTIDEVAAARTASRQLAPFLSKCVSAHIVGIDDEVELPAMAVSLLVNMLTEMAKGNAISVTSIPREMSALQAAAFLNVAQSFLNEQMTEGLIPHRIVGEQPRFCLDDLLEYQLHLQAKRSQALDDLAEQAQDLNMGY